MHGISATSPAPAAKSALRPEFVMLPLLWVSVALVLSPSLLGGNILDALSTDDAMHLVEVRDLLNGQGWYDLVQHRGMPPDGISIHWSRIIDIPLALIILATRPFVGQAGAEALAMIAWPLTLLGAAMTLVCRIADKLAGPRAVVPALALSALGVATLGHFRAGCIDHHGAQTVLMLGLALCAGQLDRHWRYPALAGAMAAFSMAIGVEMIPIIVAVGLAVTLFAIWRGAAAARGARILGLSLAGTAFVLFPLFVDVATLLRPVCDSFGGPVLLLAGGGGLGLAMIATVAARPASTRALRLTVAAGIGALVAGAFALAFPECLRAPYGAVDPRIQTLWLDTVVETLSFPRMVRNFPEECLAVFGYPLIAMVAAAIAWARSGKERSLAWGIMLAATAAHFCVSLWEIRGATAAALSSAPLLGAALAVLMPTVEAAYARRALVVAVLLSPLSLLSLGEAAKAAVDRIRAKPATQAAADARRCTGVRDVQPLAALPTGRVLSFIDLGPAILAETPHSIIAAPYHRNVAGNGAMLDVMLGSDAVARRVLTERAIDYVVICPSAAEQANYAREAPQGLAARLVKGETPDFLVRLPLEGGNGLMAWRVVR